MMKRSSTVKKASLENFITLKVIGKGSYGKVFMVEQKGTGKIFAMKVLKKGAIADERGKQRVMTERDIIMTIRHPYIVTLHYSFQTDTKLFFILDFLNGGDLYTHIMNYGKFNERRARFYTAELVLALNHLHENGIVYRDLKPQNIIIDNEGHIKLTDFGLSKANFEEDQTNTI
jgi:serine/threonine protein kinase